ncbi:MAG: hypothetical protein GF398_10045 [Chitinivibrionales bacterium]|nr:hypothetical protein [Chitinivibrionales bacterium]
MDLPNQHCKPCEGGVAPLSNSEEDSYLREVQGWELSREGIHCISKQFTFNDFAETMRFVNQVAELAEAEGHHPDMQVSYGRLVIALHTHAILGLSENDYILASKIDRIS